MHRRVPMLSGMRLVNGAPLPAHDPDHWYDDDHSIDDEIVHQLFCFQTGASWCCVVVHKMHRHYGAQKQLAVGTCMCLTSLRRYAVAAYAHGGEHRDAAG